MSIDLSNVQGIVTQIYRYPFSRHLLFKFEDPQGARAFLGGLLDQITWANQDLGSKPPILMNLGLTYQGLLALGVERAVVNEFDRQFIDGPLAGPLGDVSGSKSDPASWWEGQFSTKDVHCVLHLYCWEDMAREEVSKKLRADARQNGVMELVPRQDGSPLDGQSLSGKRKLHFGYTDGISFPNIRWDDETEGPSEINFRHFLLGYSSPSIQSSPKKEPAAQWARDGSYEIFRWIYQDVASFNKYLKEEGPHLAPDLPTKHAEELLAAKLMGRWRDGTPLVLSPNQCDPVMADRNDFLYQASDPTGIRCPFSAHIRIVNPRDQKLDPAVVEGVPKVIRRGMPYGPELNSTEDDGVDRGIVGVFLCSDIRRQFYTLTGWAARNSFSPVFTDHGNRRSQDPLVGNRSVDGVVPDFIVPTAEGAVTLKGLPDFVHTKGTAFFLVPSRAAFTRLVDGQ